MKRRQVLQGLAAVGAGFLPPAIPALKAMTQGALIDGVPFTVSDLAVAIRKGGLTAMDVAGAVIDRVNAAGVLEAFITFEAGGLREAAASADRARKRGDDLGPLHGVPIALKDNIEVAGFPSTGGTPALRNFRPQRNAPVAQRLLDAGALVAGKVNMAELAGGGSTNNPTFGRTRNPYNIEHIPGGSSGGSAAAVAARLVPAALGTDTAGSIRMPAAYCGIAGFRPTQNRIPIEGIAPLALSRDTCGPLATTVADVALLDGILANNPAPVEPGSLRGGRLGLPKAVFQDNLLPSVAKRFDEVVNILAREGVTFVSEDIPDLATMTEQTTLITIGGAFRADMTGYLKDRNTGVSFDSLAEQIADPFVRNWLEPYLAPTDEILSAYADAMANVMPKLRQTYVSYLSGNRLDGILFPTAPVTAGIEVNTDGDMIIEGTLIADSIWLNIQNTGPATLWGGPGLSIPAGLSGEGLPIGIELDGPIGGDKNVLALGLSIESVMPPTPAPV